MTDLPLVSVIMPVREEASFIARSLGAVLAQDYPAERLEVLVADGRSTDGTRDIVLTLQTQHANVHLIDNPGLIVPTGLNAALRHVRGEVVVRVDGHTEIAPDYVRQCVLALQRTGADNVGGRMNAVGIGAFGQAVALATSTPFGVGNARFHYSEREESVDTVYMGAWRREVFARIGLFDEELTRDQDDEFNYRLRRYGGRVVLTPTIQSRYTTRSTPRALWRQYFQYGFWKVRVTQKHPQQMRLRQFVPAAFVLTSAVAAVLASVSPNGWRLFSVAVAAYAISDCAASAFIAYRHGWRHFGRLLLIFPILHIAYGAGFVTGLAKFATRWRNNMPEVGSPEVP